MTRKNLGTGPPTTLDILVMSHGLKMFRPNTGTITAKMIPLQSFWGTTHQEMMGVDHSSIEPEVSVTLRGQSTKPNRTAIGTAWVDLWPKTVGWWRHLVRAAWFMGVHSGWHRVHSLMSTRTAVPAARPPFIVPRVRKGYSNYDGI